MPFDTELLYFNALLDLSEDGLFACDADMRIVIWNSAAEGLLGITREQALGQTLHSLLPSPDDSGGVSLRQRLQREQAVVLRLQRGAGWLEMLLTPLWDERQHLHGCLSKLHPLSTRSPAPYLGEQDELLRALIEASPTIIFVKDRSGRYLLMNAAFSSVFGITLSYVLGKNDEEIFGESVGRLVAAHDAEVFKGQGVQTFHEQIWVRDRVRTFESRKSVYRNPEGQILGLVGIAQDVTESLELERRQAARYVVTQILAETTTLEDSARELLKAVADSVDSLGAALWLADRSALRCAGVWASAQPTALRAFTEARQVERYGKGEGVAGKAWATGEVVWQTTDLPVGALEAGIRGLYAFPISFGKDVYGAIQLFSANHTEPDDGFVLLMAALGAQMGQFMQRKQAELALKASEKRLALLVEACGALVGVLDTESVLSNILIQAGNLISADAYAVWRHRDDDVWKIAAHRGLSDMYAQSFIDGSQSQTRFEDLPDIAPVPDVFAQPLLDNRRQLYLDEGIKSLLLSRLHIGQEQATIVFYFKTQRQFSPLDLRTAAVLANLGGATLRNTELYEAARKAETEIRQNQERFGLAVKAGQMGIWEWEVETGQLHMSEAALSMHDFPPQSTPLAPDVMARVHPDDPSAITSQSSGGSTFGFQYRLRHQDGHTVWIESKGRALRDDDGVPTRYVGVCMDVTEQRQMESHREMRHRVTRTLSTVQSVSEVAEAVLTAMLSERTSGWDYGEFWQLNASGDGMERLASKASRDVDVQSFLQSGHGLPLSEALDLNRLSSGEVLWINDFSEYPTASAALDGLLTGVIVPLMVGTRMLGSIHLFLKEMRKRNVDVVETLAGIGSHIGQFLERLRSEEQRRLVLLALQEEQARLQESVRNEQAAKEQLAQALDEERALVQRLAESFLGAIPQFRGVDLATLYHAAFEAHRIGGDYYDFIVLSPTRLGVVIGDVCGKGVAASTYTAMAKYMLRAYLRNEESAARTISRLNSAVFSEMRDGMFLSMVFAVLDSEANTLTYVNAGHPSPLLIDGQQIVSLEPTGGVMGAESDWVFEERVLPLPPGSLLVLFTDGVTEAGGTADDEGLADAVWACREQPAEEVANAIFERARERSKGVLRDDVAIVVLRRLPGSAA